MLEDIAVAHQIKCAKHTNVFTVLAIYRCIERNGVITSYTVVFQEQGGALIPGELNVMDRTFIASGLTPHTNYIFRVAGVNSNGTGPYSNDITVLTDEDGINYNTNTFNKFYVVQGMIQGVSSHPPMGFNR